MNTPRSKPLIRAYQPSFKWRSTPDGHYRQGLENSEMVSAIGEIVTSFPMIECAMIGVLEDLLGGSAPARQVFYSIVNQQARIAVMRSLLEQATINIMKDGWYDWALDEYKAVSNSRNMYAHGLWWTHESGKSFISLDESSIAAVGQWREVVLPELNAVLLRMQNLFESLRSHEIARLQAAVEQRSLPEIHPQQPDVGNGTAHSEPHTTCEEPLPPPPPSDPSPQSDDPA